MAFRCLCVGMFFRWGFLAESARFSGFDDINAHHSDSGDGAKAGVICQKAHQNANQKRGQSGADGISHEKAFFLLVS